MNPGHHQYSFCNKKRCKWWGKRQGYLTIALCWNKCWALKLGLFFMWKPAQEAVRGCDWGSSTCPVLCHSTFPLGTSTEAMVGRSVKGTELAENWVLKSPLASLEDTYTTHALCLTSSCADKQYLLEAASHCTSVLSHRDKYNLLLDELQ